MSTATSSGGRLTALLEFFKSLSALPLHEQEARVSQILTRLTELQTLLKGEKTKPSQRAASVLLAVLKELKGASREFIRRWRVLSLLKPRLEWLSAELSLLISAEDSSQQRMRELRKLRRWLALGAANTYGPEQAEYELYQVFEQYCQIGGMLKDFLLWKSSGEPGDLYRSVKYFGFIASLQLAKQACASGEKSGAGLWLEMFLRFSEDPTSKARAKLESQLVFGPKAVPQPDFGLSLYSNSEGPLVPEFVIEKLLCEANARVINRSLGPGPKLGFGRRLSPEEITGALSHEGAYLLTLDYLGSPFCFLIFYTREAHFPSYLSGIVSHLRTLHELSSHSDFAWLDYVLISEQGRGLLRQRGVRGYALANWLSLLILSSMGLESLYCSTRAGEHANTAFEIALRNGWRFVTEIPASLLGSFSPDPARVLALDAASLQAVLDLDSNRSLRTQRISVG